MKGPKVLARPQAVMVSGIAPSPGGGWFAYVNGDIRGPFTGLGCKAKAIRVAGTNRRVDW